MENDEQLPCSDKLAFETLSQASGAGAASEWQYGNKLKPYRCQYCRLWHLSSQPSD